LDTDVVVYWRHQTGLPGSIDLVPYKEASDSRGAFMLVLTPGDDLKPITEGRDWVFVLDTSGSMSAKYHTLVEGVAKGLSKFRPEDRFRFIVFNSQASEVGAGFVNATPENIKHAVAALRAITPGNSTNLYAGLEKGLEGLDSDRSSGIVLVTDGVANVGVTKKRSFLKLVKKQDVRLYTMVMGNSANRPLLEAISKESGGTAVNVSNSDDIIGAVLSATSKLSHEAMHDVKVTIKGLRTADIAPKRIGSLYRGQQLVLFGHYWGEGEADVRLTAKVSGKPVTYDARFTFPDIATLNPEIKRLWSYAAIEDLMQEMDITGEDADTEQAITDLAVEGGLVTPYTSMVVVREEVYVARGIARDNAQRIKMEQQAQAQRQSQPVQSRRVDQTVTAFNSPQPSYGGGSGGSSSGGGALGPFGAMLMLSFAAMVFLLRRRQTRDTA
jgi:Ca-activated chloride channel family protein